MAESKMRHFKSLKTGNRLKTAAPQKKIETIKKKTNRATKELELSILLALICIKFDILRQPLALCYDFCHRLIVLVDSSNLNVCVCFSLSFSSANKLIKLIKCATSSDNYLFNRIVCGIILIES